MELDKGRCARRRLNREGSRDLPAQTLLCEKIDLTDWDNIDRCSLSRIGGDAEP